MSLALEREAIINKLKISHDHLAVLDKVVCCDTCGSATHPNFSRFHPIEGNQTFCTLECADAYLGKEGKQ